MPFIGSAKVNPLSGTDIYLNGYFESTTPRHLLLLNNGVFSNAMVVDGNNDGFEFSSSDTELGSTVSFRTNDIQLKHDDSLTGENMALFIKSSGIEFISELGSYLFPRIDGAAGQVLSTDGSGQLGWVTVSGGGSGITGIGTIDSITRSANGAGISGNNLILQTGNKVLPGLLIGETNSNGVTLGVGAGVGADTTNGVFIGVSAGYDAFALTGANFIGNHAGYDADFAIDSTFIGRFAGAYAQQADHSSFIGTYAGNAATSANYSVFIGEDAGRNATNASNSIFLGYQTGRGATDANNSVFIGDFAGYGAVTAKSSIFIGAQAGYNDTVNNSNSESILIGNSTSTGGHGDSIAIGTNATNTASNQFMIGSTGTPINEVVIKGSGTCSIVTTGISCSSDERLKTNIENLESTTLDTLLNVKTVRYNWNANPTGQKTIGFLAQDLEQYYPELVRTDSDGFKMVNYAQMTPILVQAIREMNLNITELANMERPNTWRDSLIAWFGNVENGITEFFVGRAHMRELCIGEQNNETCLTKDQIDQLLQILPTEQYETTNPIIENTPPVGESVNETEIIDTEGELTEENVPESTNPVIETKPEPEAEPQVVSENNSADTSEQ